MTSIVPEVDQKNPVQDPVHEQSEQDQDEPNQPIDTDRPSEETLAYSVPEEPVPSPVPDLEADDSVESTGASAPEIASPAPMQERIIVDRCTSPLCPVPNPHNRGLYLHNGQFQPDEVIGMFQFGLSNPPPHVWQMMGRMYLKAEFPMDWEAVDAFIRNHTFHGYSSHEGEGEGDGDGDGENSTQTQSLQEKTIKRIAKTSQDWTSGEMTRWAGKNEEVADSGEVQICVQYSLEFQMSCRIRYAERQ